MKEKMKELRTHHSS